MHSNIGLNDGLLFRRNTNLCMGGGWSKSIKFLNNCLYIDSDVKTISTDCFGFDLIGPGKAIIFEDFISLQKESIASPQFRHIVFKNDAFIDGKAFFSKQCNSNLYKHYVLYCYKGSNVEKFADKHGFKFETLDKFNYKNKTNSSLYCISYTTWLSFKCHNYHLFIGEDYAYLIKQAKEENGDYMYYQIPFSRSQFVTPIKQFIQLFVETATEEEKRKLCDNRYLCLKGETALKYLNLLEKCFKNTELIKKWKYLSKENYYV